MIFYLAMGALFTLYGIDLMGLVIISAIARAREVAAALKQKKAHKKRKRVAADGDKQERAGTFAFGNDCVLEAGELTLTNISLKHVAAKPEQHPPPITVARTSHSSSASPPSTPQAPTSPKPNQRPLTSKISCASSLTEITTVEDGTVVVTDPSGAEPADNNAQLQAGSTSGSVRHPQVPSLHQQEPSTCTSSSSPNSTAAAAGAVPTANPLLTCGSEQSFASSACQSSRPYGWGFGQGMLNGSGGSGVTLPSSGGSGLSTLRSSGGSGASSDFFIKAEISSPFTDKDNPDSMKLKKQDIWPLPLEQYPLVLIQVPMYNEEAHAELIVERCCAIVWPKTRLLIQVLDDSTKLHIRERVDAAVVAAMERGHPVQVLRRTNRQGFKAGAMVEGLEHVAPFGFKYVAIFDADFEPPSDFLLETIGPLEGDDKLGFVQTRWLNPSKSFLTWAQKVNLGFHFDVEQRARSFMGWFFNFNGTAGVWRIQAIETAGGWESDTVVEDMDLSLRAYLYGWKGLYLPHVGCINEVPDDLCTYKTQQYRWLCGPMQILVKAFLIIWRAKAVPLSKRMCCYWFFARYVLFGVVTVAVLAVPPVALWLDPWEWRWPQIYMCASVNFALAVYLYITPFSIAYLLFSVAVGYFKAWAMLGGLLGTKKSKSWKVTVKKGVTAEAGPVSLWQRTKDCVSHLGKPYALEFGLFIYYAGLAVLAFLAVGLPSPSWLMGGYCSLMAIIFLVLSFGDAFL